MKSILNRRVKKIMIALMVMLGVALIVGHFSSETAYAEEQSEKGIIAPAPFPAGEIPGDEVHNEHVGEGTLLLARCNYLTQGDNPHISREGPIASAHGWWEDLSPGQCPEKADVTIWLQARFCYFDPDGNPRYCWYRTVGYDKKRVRAGGGSGKWATARNACASSQLVGYRSVIDVDLVGIWDGWGRTYKYKNLNCYPS